MDPCGANVTKTMIVKQLTDDGHLEDRHWNLRHAIHPTAFNDKNSTYYKVTTRLLFQCPVQFDNFCNLIFLNRLGIL
jgi:hypothetical protein